MSVREGRMQRQTRETAIDLKVKLAPGESGIHTGLGFFDHMLQHVARQGHWTLDLKAQGDLHVDGHHTVEDVAICLGEALRKSLGDKSGIRRYGSAVVPMDEALAEVHIDLSGRPCCVFHDDAPKARVGDFDSELAEEFCRALANHLRAAVHVNIRYGSNLHHRLEALFKALGQALGQAVTVDERIEGQLSTKGWLES